MRFDPFHEKTERGARFPGARVCDPQQRSSFNLSAIIPHASGRAKLRRVTDPRSGADSGRPQQFPSCPRRSCQQSCGPPTILAGKDARPTESFRLSRLRRMPSASSHKIARWHYLFEERDEALRVEGVREPHPDGWRQPFKPAPKSAGKEVSALQLRCGGGEKRVMRRHKVRRRRARCQTRPWRGGK